MGEEEEGLVFFFNVLNFPARSSDTPEWKEEGLLKQKALDEVVAESESESESESHSATAGCDVGVWFAGGVGGGMYTFV